MLVAREVGSHLHSADDLCSLGLELCGVAGVGLPLAVFQAAALVVF